MLSFVDITNSESIDDHHHLCIRKSNAFYSSIVLREFKSTFLQSFVVQAKTDPLPMQELDLISTFVDKDKHIAMKGISIQDILNKT